jgi:hypothetical protein
VIENSEQARDLNALVVPRLGSLGDSGDPFEPYRLLDGTGRVVGPVAAYLRDLQARGLPETTQRSYGLALPGWFRCLGAVGVSWERATRVEARDFCRWGWRTSRYCRIGGIGTTRWPSPRPGGRRGVGEPGDREDTTRNEVRAGDCRA